MSIIKIASQNHEEILSVDFVGGKIESINDIDFIQVEINKDESYSSINLSYKQVIILIAHLKKIMQIKKDYDEVIKAKQWQEKIQQYEQLKQELSEYGYLK